MTTEAAGKHTDAMKCIWQRIQEYVMEYRCSKKRKREAQDTAPDRTLTALDDALDKTVKELYVMANEVANKWPKIIRKFLDEDIEVQLIGVRDIVLKYHYETTWCRALVSLVAYLFHHKLAIHHRAQLLIPTRDASDMYKGKLPVLQEEYRIRSSGSSRCCK